MYSNLIELARIGICALSFSIASYQDIKDREISSIIWFLSGGAGLILILLEHGYKAIFCVISVIFLFYPTFFEFSNKAKIIFVSIGIAIFIVDIIYSQAYQLVSPPLVILLGHLLYRTRVLMGGADAKAFMVLGIMFPVYPSISIFSIPPNREFYNVVFPFAITVILYASLALVLLIPYNIAINLRRGKIKFPHMLFGYTIKIEDFDKKFVWLLEHVDEDRIFLKFSPMENREKEDLEKFKKLGYTEVWVQPQIPFILFMLIGFILAIIIGNPLFRVIG